MNYLLYGCALKVHLKKVQYRYVYIYFLSSPLALPPRKKILNARRHVRGRSYNAQCTYTGCPTHHLAQHLEARPTQLGH